VEVRFSLASSRSKRNTFFTRHSTCQVVIPVLRENCCGHDLMHVADETRNICWKNFGFVCIHIGGPACNCILSITISSEERAVKHKYICSTFFYVTLRRVSAFYKTITRRYKILQKVRKATISFVMPVCPFVRPSAWNNSTPTGRIWMKFHFWAFVQNHRENSSVIKIGQDNGYFTWRSFLIYDHMSLNSQNEKRSTWKL
jgi:hypothetical protein